MAVSSAASGRSSNALGSGGTLKSCIDDSDCQKLGEGSKYACFAVRAQGPRAQRAWTPMPRYVLPRQAQPDICQAVNWRVERG